LRRLPKHRRLVRSGVRRRRARRTRPLVRARSLDHLEVRDGEAAVVDIVEVCNSLNPKVVIPMHFKNRQSNDIPGSTVDEFLKLMDKGGNLKGGRGGFGSMDFKSSELPSATQVIVL